MYSYIRMSLDHLIFTDKNVPVTPIATIAITTERTS